MTCDELIEITDEIGRCFPHLDGTRLEKIGDSIVGYPLAVVRANLDLQFRNRRWFDLEAMLKACRDAERIQRPAAVDLAAQTRRRLAGAEAARAAKEAQAAVVDALPDDELRAVADAVIAKQTAPSVAATLRRRDPRTDMVFRLLIAAHLTERPAAAGVSA